MYNSREREQKNRDEKVKSLREVLSKLKRSIRVIATLREKETHECWVHRETDFTAGLSKFLVLIDAGQVIKPSYRRRWSKFY